MTAYYNEIDPKAAAWLKELIKQGLIAPGVVDTRSIEDITANELTQYTQCHFFAGIGVWSYALRQAGWGDDRPVWTGSCPCQPFSTAGKRTGTADERHLWPAWEYLIAQCGPEVVFGEQVASKDGLAWLDTVQTDLEGSGYAFGANDLCAAGVGAPHIRQRFWFVAERMGNTEYSRPQGRLSGGQNTERENINGHAGCDSPTSRLADTEHDQQRQGGRSRCESASRNEPWAEPSGCSAAIGLADTEHNDWRPDQQRRQEKGRTADFWDSEDDDPMPNPTNGFWANVDWLGCRDGKFRPVEPGTFPLVDGPPARVGRLRGYGNAINAEVARIFIESYMESKQ